METEEIQLSTVVLASPNQVYSAWLDERQHTAFTGARATVEPWVGGRYTAWDGYATALIVGLDTGKTILLTWRTADFAPDFPDSHVEFHLESIAGGTRVTIKQRGIPKGHAAQYKDAWKKHYLDSMKKLFAKPEALRNALREASRAGRLPIPGVTAARPGTVRPFTVRSPDEIAAVQKTKAKIIRDDDDDDSDDREGRFQRYDRHDDYDRDRPSRRPLSRDASARPRSKPVPLPKSMREAAKQPAPGKKSAKPEVKAKAAPKAKPASKAKSPAKAAPAPKAKAGVKAKAKPAAKKAPSKKVPAKAAKKPAKAPARKPAPKAKVKKAAKAKPTRKAAKKAPVRRAKPAAKKKPAKKK